MINIVYIHGFRSGGRGGKYDRLKRRFRSGFKIHSPSFSDSIGTAKRELLRLMNSKEIISGDKTVVIGTSLGGFYAYYLSVLFNLKSILINPVLNPSEHMKKYADTIQKNFRSGRKFKFSQKDIDELRSMEIEIEKNNPEDQKKKIFVVIGEKDDVINRKVVEEKFGNIFYMDEGHEFNEKFDQLITTSGVRDFIQL